ncbi:MAG: sulfite exporter TauE/SafE family protein [Mariprofundaceae bacterium]|nr:sulfite exporter TauE/SafE family protein [Mariprofundaceae bacterium]
MITPLLLTALLIGLVLGLFGAGGGMLTVPALMIVGEISVKEAVPMSLWIVALVSLTAAIHQKVWQEIEYRLLIVLGVTGMIGSGAGAGAGTLISDQLQLGLLSVLILFVALWVGFVRLENKVAIFRYIPALLAGLLIGFLTGLLGVGGGFLLVPVLIFLGVRHFPTAVGHSLLLIAANAISGALVYLWVEQANIDISMTLTVTVIAAVGSVLGGLLLKRIPSAMLQKGFAMLLIMLGCFVGWQSLSL